MPAPRRARPVRVFHSVVDLGDCAQKVLPLDQMEKASRARQDRCSTFAPGATVERSASDLDDPILKSKPYKEDGLVVILFDHAPDALVLSPFVEAGSTNDRPYDSYSLLKTIEDRIGLGEHLGRADGKDVHAFGKDVFDTDSIPPGPGVTRTRRGG